MTKPQRKYRHANEAYLEGISSGDRAILTSIFEEFLPGIIRHVKENSGNQQDAEDIFTDALEVIFRKVKAVNFILTCQFYSYLFEICKRMWWKKLRRKKFQSKVTTDDERVLKMVETTTEQIEKTERHKLFREKFALLGEDCRKVLQMALYEDKSMVEIAEVMGYASQGYARKRKFSCKEKLVGLIEQDARFRELKS